MKKLFNLTEQEVNFLKYLAEGLKISEAAENLHVSVKRAAVISQNVRTKLNAKNLANAVYIAFNNKIID